MTRKQQAERGIISDEMRAAALHEGLSPEAIREGLAAGRVVIPKNVNRNYPHIRAVGQGTRTKVNANIGASPLRSDPDEELGKLAAAQESGADAVMDLSLGADQLRIRKAILERAEVMVGTVPLYQSAFELSAARRDVTEMTIADFLKTGAFPGRGGRRFHDHPLWCDPSVAKRHGAPGPHAGRGQPGRGDAGGLDAL